MNLYNRFFEMLEDKFEMDRSDRGLLTMSFIVIIVAFIFIWVYRDEIRQNHENNKSVCANGFCAVPLR